MHSSAGRGEHSPSKGRPETMMRTAAVGARHSKSVVVDVGLSGHRSIQLQTWR